MRIVAPDRVDAAMKDWELHRGVGRNDVAPAVGAPPITTTDPSAENPVQYSPH
jgi:hypothetical protein